MKVLVINLTHFHLPDTLTLMRGTMHISLPSDMREWVEGEILRNGFRTASQYFFQLLREEQKRQRRLAIEEKLLEALGSGAPAEVTSATWQASEKRVVDRLKASGPKRRTHGQTR